LKIVANLLHSGKHAVDKVEQKPWSNNETWMCYDCHIDRLHINNELNGNAAIDGGVNETEKG